LKAVKHLYLLWQKDAEETEEEDPKRVEI